MSTDWKAAKHRPIVKLADNLWTVEADVPRIPILRRMTCVKLSTGDLVVHSAVALDDDAMAEIEAWGTPRYLVVPNDRHRLDAPRYKARYPDMTVVCPTPVRDKVAEKVDVDGGLDALPSGDCLEVVVIDGGKIGEAALLVDTGSGVAAIFGDTLFNVPRVNLLNPLGLFIKLVGSVGKPKVTNIGKRALVADKKRFADSLRDIAAIPELALLVPGHGDVVSEDAAAVLGRVADDLAR